MTLSGINKTFAGQSSDVYRASSQSSLTSTSYSQSLKKHVAIIHCANRLSLLEHKISNALLYNAYPRLLQDEEHTIDIKDLCNLIGYDSKDFKLLKNAIKNLIATVIEWNLLAKDTENTNDYTWVASSILADVCIQKSICTYSYSRKVRELLHQPQMYGRIDMKTQAKFKSSYGLTLYENCIRYQNLDQTPWIYLPIFRKLMGVDPLKYPIFRDFKKRVLNIAIEEVNKHSPINIRVMFSKRGSAVEALQFLIERKQLPIKNTEENTYLEEQEDDLMSKLINDFAISKNIASRLVGKYSREFICEKINSLITSDSFKKGTIRNIGAYLVDSIKNNYQPSKSSHDINQELKATQFQQERAARRIKVEEDSKKINFQHYLDEDFIEKMQSLDEKTLLNYIDDFFMHEKKHRPESYKMLVDLYKQSGLSSKLFQVSFKNHMQQYNLYIPPCTYDEFLNKIRS